MLILTENLELIFNQKSKGRPNNDLTKFKNVIKYIHYDNKKTFIIKESEDLEKTNQDNYLIASEFVKYLLIDNDNKIKFSINILSILKFNKNYTEEIKEKMLILIFYIIIKYDLYMIDNDEIEIPKNIEEAKILFYQLKKKRKSDESINQDNESKYQKITNEEFIFFETKDELANIDKLNKEEKLIKKELINTFIELLQKYMVKDKKGKAIILKSKNKDNFLKFVKIFDPEDILMGNYGKNNNKIRLFGTKNFKLIDSANNFLKKNKLELFDKVSSAWFDFYDDFEGNSLNNIYPKKDIKKFFKFKFPKENCILGITFTDLITSDKKLDNIKKFIKDTAEKNNYYIEEITSKSYLALYTLFYRIYKKR